MKKNLNCKELTSTAYVSRDGLVTHIDKYILFSAVWKFTGQQ